MPPHHLFFDKQRVEDRRIRLEMIRDVTQAVNTGAVATCFYSRRSPGQEKRYQAYKSNPRYIEREVFEI